jgi:hypothetical protein
MARYVTFCDPKPSGPKSGQILRPVPEVVFDLYEIIKKLDRGAPTPQNVEQNIFEYIDCKKKYCIFMLTT